MNYAPTNDVPAQWWRDTAAALSNLSTSSPQVFNVKSYGAVGDGTTDDTAAIQSAMNAAGASGGVLSFPTGTYLVSSAIVPKSKVLVRGSGAASAMISNANIYWFTNSTDAITDFSIEDMTFLGNNTNAQLAGAVLLDGSLDASLVPAGPVITNFVMRNCYVRNTSSLPIKIFGVTGKTIVSECEFNHCADAGFIYDDEVIFIGNHSINSSDNGFSISRATHKVVCANNTVESPNFYGIFCGGFSGTVGPTFFSCTGNTVKNARYSALYLEGSPSYGVVSGNFLDQGHNRINDSNCDGISLYGDSTTQYANILNITGNTIVNASRAGIAMSQAQNVLVSSNLIIDPGTQFKADGTTTITTTDTTTNAGVLTTNLGTYANIWVSNNAVFDTRATAYCNWDFWKVGTSGLNYGINTSAGMRNSSQLLFTFNKSSSSQLPIFGIQGGIQLKKTSVADAAYTVASTDRIVAYTSLTAARTVTLSQAAAVPGMILTIKDETGTAATNNLTVTRVLSDHIDGATTQVINTNYGSLTMYSDGSNWFLI